jgi:hypothetical protein
MSPALGGDVDDAVEPPGGASRWGRTEVRSDAAPPHALTPSLLRTPRSAGVAGVLFALVFALIDYLIHRVVPANPHDAGSWLLEATDRREVSWALGLVPFCGIFFLWFIGAVRSRIGDAEDRFFSTVFFGSGVLFIAMLFVSTSLMAALLSLAAANGGRPPIDVWQLGRSTTFTLTSTYAMRMAAVFMMASSTIALRLRIHRPVIVWLGYLGAVVLLIAVATVPWVELVFPAWVLIVSLDLLVQSYRSAR